MDNLNKSHRELNRARKMKPVKVSIGEPPKLPVFTFVPVVWELPKGSTEEEEPAALTGSPNESVSASREETTGDTMSDGEIFKVEKVFIKEREEGGARNTNQQQTTTQFKASLDHMGPESLSVADSMPCRVSAVTSPMETAAYKHRGVSQPSRHDTSALPETHKIKLSYKSLAAIPTNTLLLDQQVIDEQVERGQSPYDTLDVVSADTHAEMCSPSQFRQQSEELYAVIDEILANSTPPSPSRSAQTSRSSTPNIGQSYSSLPKTFGRETKYASLSSLNPSNCKERNDPKKTKPGVIRPMTAIPRLTVNDKEEFRPNPFRQLDTEWILSDNKRLENRSLQKSGKDLHAREMSPERRTPFSTCDLQITEPEDHMSLPVKDASTTFSRSEGRITSETHI